MAGPIVLGLAEGLLGVQAAFLNADLSTGGVALATQAPTVVKSCSTNQALVGTHSELRRG